MRRRSVIIILLVVLLLIAGGAIGFRFLRPREQPSAKFAEIESFFQQFPASAGWTVTGMNEGRRAVATGSGWLEGIGYRRLKEYRAQTYWLANSRTHRLANIKIYREDERLILIDVFAATPADGEELSRMLLEKFPRLQPILNRYP